MCCSPRGRAYCSENSFAKDGKVKEIAFKNFGASETAPAWPLIQSPSRRMPSFWPSQPFALVFSPRNDASDRFQLGLLCPRASIFAMFFLLARFLRALVPPHRQVNLFKINHVVTTLVFVRWQRLAQSGSRNTLKRIAMLAISGPRSSAIDQFTDFAHDILHPGRSQGVRASVIFNAAGAPRPLPDARLRPSGRSAASRPYACRAGARR